MKNEELQFLGEVAREAGALIAGFYAREFSVDFKSPGDPVTDADRQANTLICERLRERFPGDAIVAEESDPRTFAGYRSSPRVFFVDPLDGTREFVARNGEFVVMIGLVEGDQAQAGVVYSPTRDRLWSGARGVGAFCRSPDGTERRIGVTSAAHLAASRLVVSRSRRGPELERALEQNPVREVARVGSAGLKGAEVAQASADAYVALGRSGKLWDACAVDALVSAAGGRFTDARGQIMDYRAEDLDLSHGVLACAPALQRPLLRLLQAV